MTEKRRVLGKNRIEALTDGIYAIALTLAVLTIDVDELPPVGTDGQFIDSLAVTFPQILHYAIAFFVLVSFWIAHHRQVNYVSHVDSTFIWLNVVTLFFVALIPFTTDLVGTYTEYSLAVTFYAGNLCMIGLLTTVSWIYIAGKGRLISESISEEAYISGIARGMTVPLVSIIIIVYANLVSASNSTYLFLLIPVIMVFVNKMMKRFFSPDKKMD
jgi:uncharacterized membrane protein